MTAPDVTIIGAGIMGCACAYYLAAAGARVLVLEKGAVGSGASSAGMSHIVTWEEPETHLALARASRRLYEQLSEQLYAETGISIEYRRTGSMAVVEEEDGLRAMQEMASRLQAWGVECSLLDSDDLRRMEPGLTPGLAGGAFFPGDGMVNPLLVTQAFKRGATAKGAEFRQFVEVQGAVRGTGGRITALQAGGEVISSGIVVVAAGAWSGQVGEMLGFPVPVAPRKGVLAITATAPDGLVNCKVILSAGYMDSVRGEDTGGTSVAANIQQVKNGNFLLGSTRQFAGFDREVEIKVARAMLARCARFLPGLKNLPLLRTWAGLRPYTPDLLPVIGAVETIPGLYFASGHEGIGITEAPITGWLVKQMVFNEPTGLPVERVSPDRFQSPFNA